MFSFRIFKTKLIFGAIILNNQNWEYSVQQLLSLELQVSNKENFSTSIFTKLGRRSKTAADPGFSQGEGPMKSQVGSKARNEHFPLIKVGPVKSKRVLPQPIPMNHSCYHVCFTLMTTDKK